MDRRKFCFSCAAVAAGIEAARAGSLFMRETGSPRALPLALHKVIFDSRFAESRAFGQAAAGAGRQTAAIRGDVTALWYHDLRLLWATSRGATAGMTTRPSFFCLQQLAQDHWMRVIASTPSVDPRLVSWVIAPRSSYHLPGVAT
jgi:hypothetical protein